MPLDPLRPSPSLQNNKLPTPAPPLPLFHSLVILNSLNDRLHIHNLINHSHELGTLTWEVYRSLTNTEYEGTIVSQTSVPCLVSAPPMSGDPSASGSKTLRGPVDADKGICGVKVDLRYAGGLGGNCQCKDWVTGAEELKGKLGS